MLKIGIIGLANVGKSSLFKALTNKAVACANFPFCTIEPNEGIVPVPDHRLNKLAQLTNSAKIIPTTIKFVDIAGLVRNAHKGEGLGNKFLGYIREVDLILHLVRGFNKSDISHVEKRIDPADDIEIVQTELILADLEAVSRQIEKVNKEAKSGDKNKISQSLILNKIKNNLLSGKLARETKLTDEEALNHLNNLQLLTTKPMLIVVNCDENIAGLKDKVKANLYLPVLTELNIQTAKEDEKQNYRQLLTDSGLNTIDDLITACYRKLNLVTFLTTGQDETRAWTIEVGSKAPKAGAAIHTDFEKKFIRAEVINWQKLIEVSSFALARTKGLLRLEGKDYMVQDGDVIEFKIQR